MKILVQWGSKGNSLIDHLIGPLAKVNDVSSILLICRRPGPIIPKVEYHCPPKFFSRMAVTYILYEFFNLLYCAIFERPTHVVGFLLYPHGLMAFIVAKLTRRKIIISLIAGPAELRPEGSIQGNDYNNTTLPWLGKMFLGILKRCDAIITTGSFTKDYLVRNYIETPIYSMINPPNKSRFHPLEVPKIYDVVSIGRLVPLKHFEIIIHAISKVKEKYPDIKAVIVGDGTCKTRLINLADELGIKKNIDFAGFQKDTPYYYNSAKIFVHSSKREGFPNVFLEAMACGLPCVISNCGDIIDIARDGSNSLIIQDFKDSDEYTCAIIKLLENEVLYHKISQNALKTIESLSDENIASQWQLLLGK